MAIDVQALLAPVSEDDPAGPDRSGAVERQPIELALALPDPIETGGPRALNRERPPDVGEAIDLIAVELGRTKDLTLGVAMASAGARMGDLDAAASGIEVVAGLLDGFWDTAHPKIEDVGVLAWRNICAGLGDSRGFVGPLLQTVLLRTDRLGEYTAADIADFGARGGQAERYGVFVKALEQAGTDPLKEAEIRLERLSAALKAVDGAFAAREEFRPELRGGAEPDRRCPQGPGAVHRDQRDPDRRGRNRIACRRHAGPGAGVRRARADPEP